MERKGSFSDPLGLPDVTVTDAFWKERIELVRTTMLPYQWEALNDRVEDAEPSYAISNFEVASGRKSGVFDGRIFQDSDVYKWLEAAAYTLVLHKDPELEARVDDVVDLICASQQADGYINCYYIINGLEKRFTNLMNNHELYCLGHLIEAAVAYHEATGKSRLLDAVVRYVDLVDTLMGPEDGKLKGYPGHEIMEMALLRLYGITKNDKHLQLAKYFIYERGQSPLFFDEECKANDNECWWLRGPLGYQYYQAGKPVLEQSQAEGHAVRAVYLYSGMASLAKETGDAEMTEACRRLWDNISHKQLYITGAVGASAYGESFSMDYDLPNDLVYGETCAAVGLAFFARRMLELAPQSDYADVLERAVYNGVISGMELDGTKFFYVNPLEVVPEKTERIYGLHHVKTERQKWFGCACCPPNLARLLASLPSYAYTKNDDTLFLHLFMGSIIETGLADARARVEITTDYPWDGKIDIAVDPEKEAEFTLAVRVPGWSDGYSVTVNGQKWAGAPICGYLYIKRVWKPGDIVEYNLSMPVQVIRANPMVRDDAGKVALQRGPLVYCLEEIDNGKDLHLCNLGAGDDFKVVFEPGLLGGVTSITCKGEKMRADDWGDMLYKPEAHAAYDGKVLKWIPYYAWANRGAGEMTVWISRNRV